MENSIADFVLRFFILSRILRRRLRRHVKIELNLLHLVVSFEDLDGSVPDSDQALRLFDLLILRHRVEVTPLWTLGLGCLRSRPNLRYVHSFPEVLLRLDIAISLVIQQY